MATQQTQGKVKVTFKQALDMLLPYIWSRITEQIKSVSLIVSYLVLFQIIILGIPIANALTVGIGIAVVVLGLALFMDGLFYGLMPLGEVCGVKLPQKTVLPIILIFAFILGVGATFAEPAIGVLKAAGSSVKAWEAPLLYLILNKFSGYLVGSVGFGVGIAVLFGMLRFLYNWSLKPFIYILYFIVLTLSIIAYFDPNIVFVTGLAWDCGGVTTGPVTVPLVIALGIGISRVASGGSGGGFGVVTLASVFPILAVLILGFSTVSMVPAPSDATTFFSAANSEKRISLYASEDEMKGYALKNAPLEAQLQLFNNNKQEMTDAIVALSKDSAKQISTFGSVEAFNNYLEKQAPYEVRLVVYGGEEKLKEIDNKAASAPVAKFDIKDLLKRNGLAALQAILPLSLFLILVLLFILREKLKRSDEVFLGLSLAVIGMALFSMGIELGLSRLGGMVGEKLPSSFKAIEMAEQKQTIDNFDTSVVNTAIAPDGSKDQFFFKKDKGRYVQMPYVTNNYDNNTKKYQFIPTRGPLFQGALGIVVVILFAFVMGYSATLAEPALNALGATVEEITVGTFKKSLLMQAVAIGVGVGIAIGVGKIIYDLPLIWLLVPPYAILMVLTAISTEEFVNIGWDSAGVTTGPVTVPLVLAMGLGIGGQVGVVEGFGILALASVYPILSVLSVGVYVTMKRKNAIAQTQKSIN